MCPLPASGIPAPLPTAPPAGPPPLPAPELTRLGPGSSFAILLDHHHADPGAVTAQTSATGAPRKVTPPMGDALKVMGGRNGPSDEANLQARKRRSVMMCAATEEFVAAFDRAQRLVEIQCPTIPHSHHQAHGHEHTIAAATRLLCSLGFPERQLQCSVFLALPGGERVTPAASAHCTTADELIAVNGAVGPLAAPRTIAAVLTALAARLSPDHPARLPAEVYVDMTGVECGAEHLHIDTARPDHATFQLPATRFGTPLDPGQRW